MYCHQNLIRYSCNNHILYRNENPCVRVSEILSSLLYRKYVPQLSKFPEKYIYEPWTAPKAVQEKCGCIIGKDYPKPIVDHDTARKANIARMAAAYARRNEGKSKKGL